MSAKARSDSLWARCTAEQREELLVFLLEAGGGFRDALAMLDAGATRLGTSGSAVILGEARRVDAGEESTGAVDASSY